MQAHVFTAKGAATPESRARRGAIAAFFDRLAPERHRWLSANAYYYAQDLAYMRFLIP